MITLKGDRKVLMTIKVVSVKGKFVKVHQTIHADGEVFSESDLLLRVNDTVTQSYKLDFEGLPATSLDRLQMMKPRLTWVERLANMVFK